MKKRILTSIKLLALALALGTTYLVADQLFSDEVRPQAQSAEVQWDKTLSVRP